MRRHPTASLPTGTPAGREFGRRPAGSRAAERRAGEVARRRAARADDARGQGRPAQPGGRNQLRRRAGARGGAAQGRRRLGALGQRHQALQRAAEDRHRGVAPQDPAAVRARRDPRLSHDLPDPDRDGVVVGPVRPRARGGDRGARGASGGRPLDVRADGGRRPRCALGTDRRGSGRGPVPRRCDGGGAGARLPGAVPGRSRPVAGLRQALRGLRQGRRRPRLRPGVRVRDRAQERLLPAVRGRRQGRRRLVHERLHGPERRAGGRQPVAAARRAARGMGFLGLRGERRLRSRPT